MCSVDFCRGQVVKSSNPFCASVYAWDTYLLLTCFLKISTTETGILMLKVYKEQTAAAFLLCWSGNRLGAWEGWVCMRQRSGVCSGLMLVMCVMLVGCRSGTSGSLY